MEAVQRDVLGFDNTQNSRSRGTSTRVDLEKEGGESGVRVHGFGRTEGYGWSGSEAP